jgi:hypothetical protein
MDRTTGSDDRKLALHEAQVRLDRLVALAHEALDHRMTLAEYKFEAELLGAACDHWLDIAEAS